MVAIFMVVSFQSLAQRAEAKKTVSEKYDVSANDKLSISNKYGKVHINTWDKNEITVDVEIKAFAGNEERAKELLDRIDIQRGKSANVIAFETVISSSSGGSWNNNGYEVNYTISMPPSNPLNVENRYGAVFLDNFKGDLNMVVKYGKLKANRISGSNKKFTIAYGGADIEALENGAIDISYSGGSIGEAGNVEINNRYGNFTIDKAKKIQTETRYGSLVIKEEAESIYGSFSYSKCQVEKLKKAIVVEAKYAGSFVINQVSRGFEKVELTGSYSSFELGFEANSKFGFKCSSSYGSIKITTPNVDIYKQIEQSQSKTFEGTVGKDGTAVVKIDTRYGSIKMR